MFSVKKNLKRDWLAPSLLLIRAPDRSLGERPIRGRIQCWQWVQMQEESRGLRCLLGAHWGGLGNAYVGGEEKRSLLHGLHFLSLITTLYLD